MNYNIYLYFNIHQNTLLQYQLNNIKLSPVTINDLGNKLAHIFHYISLKLIFIMNFNL